MFYKLDENKNVVPSTIEEWSIFVGGNLPTNFIHVGDDTVNGLRISTVFLGLCHNFNPNNNVPIVFETMVFNNDSVIYMARYTTWDEAIAGHKRAIQWVKNGCVYEN